VITYHEKDKIMKIAIHGTNNGYDTITPEPVAGLFDARPDSGKVAPRGQRAYSIHFSEDNVIFSKYKIVRDALGESRIGNVAFSLIIPNSKKLKGADVKSLLDRVDKEFSDKYIQSNNLGAVRNDWAFIEEIKKEYEPKLKNNPIVEKPPKGDGDAAFVYYSTDEDLEKYFERPYQNAYRLYRQVFFVDRELKNKDENPLNALWHSEDADLTEAVPPPEPPPPPRPVEPPKPFAGFASNESGGDRVFTGKGADEVNTDIGPGHRRKKSNLNVVLTIIATGLIIAEACVCVALVTSKKKDIESLEKKINDLRTDNTELKKNNNGLVSDTVRLNNDNDSLKKVIDHLKEQRKTLEKAANPPEQSPPPKSGKNSPSDTKKNTTDKKN
jgi:regulator of replication initiation timing